MTLPFRLALIACASLSLASLAAAEPPVSDRLWPQRFSDVAPDPGILFGTLANGMRYAIVRNDTPDHQTALRLRIGSGSMEETQDEQGLAHFLEHMAFKGSTHVPAGEMIKLLERHGLAFGPDTNAQTGFTETVFMLDLPESDPGTLDLGLMLMRETASELTLSQSAMDPERGVVLSEERLRDTPDYEAMKKRLDFEFPDQLVSHRLPIGQVEILKTAPASRLRTYYDANYRPERALLVVVGDIDPKGVEAEIKAKFSSWTGVGAPTPEPVYGEPQKRGPQAALFVQPGAHDSLSIDWLKPFEFTVETEAKDRRRQIEDVALAIVTRRLERLARSDDPPFINGSASAADEFRSARVTTLEVLPKPGGWKPALMAAVETERQAAALGVTQDEVDREVAEMRTRYQTAAAGAATRRTPDIAQEIARAADDLEVVTSPAQDLARFDRNVAGLTAAEVSRALKDAFTGSGPLVTLVSSAPIDGGQAALEAAFAAARAEPIAAEAKETLKAWPYASFGSPGVVAARSEVSDLGVTFVTFANGVRVNIKPTAFRKDQILVRARVGDGRLGLPRSEPTELWAAPALILGGPGKISLEDMEQVLASKLYRADISLGDDALTIGGATRPTDLDTQMQVLAAYISDPAFRPSAFDRVKNLFASELDQLESTPQGVFGRDGAFLLHREDDRWATPTQAEVKAATLERLRDRLQPLFATAPLEVDIVGDVSVETAIAAAARTFGALPPRPAPAPPSPAALTVKGPVTGGAIVSLTHTGRPDQAIAYEAWPTDGLFDDPQKARAVNVAAAVLELRLIDQVRIAEGATYSPSVSSNPSDVFPTYGLVAASVETPPAKIPGFFQTADALAAALRSKGPTPDELERALKPRIETLTKAQQTNEYWLNWISGAEIDPARLQVVRDTLPGYRKITAADVQAAAGYFTDANAWRLTIEAKPKAP